MRTTAEFYCRFTETKAHFTRLVHMFSGSLLPEMPNTSASKEIPHHKTQSFVIMLTTARPWSLSWVHIQETNTE
jgi:hypothetical protein